jgi:predicted TIM-barrel fold metal-dependent hydrolase
MLRHHGGKPNTAVHLGTWLFAKRWYTGLGLNPMPEETTMAHDPAPSRRDFIGAAAALGAGALLPRLAAAETPAKPFRIDTHYHYFPPAYLEPLATWGQRTGFGGLQGPQRDWTIAKALDEMDRNLIATGVMSISTPGVWFGEAEEARRMARTCNEFGARMIADHPGRFGLFASMPMPDVDGTLREIAYAFDALKADGICFMTSYGDKWPGDPQFKPVFEELNRRKAVAYFHPLAPNCCGALIPGVSGSPLEYPYDTGRAAVSLLVNGAFARYRDIKWLFSHAGAAIPVLAGRIGNVVRARKDIAEIAPDGVERELQKLHYDTANSAYAPTMAALTAFVPTSQILFGSDYPYFPISGAMNLGGLEKLAIAAADRQAIDRGNALRLLPRLNA